MKYLIAAALTAGLALSGAATASAVYGIVVRGGSPFGREDRY